MRKLIILAILFAAGSTTTLLNAQIIGDDPALFAAKNNGFQLGVGKLPVVDDDSLGAVQLQGWVTGGDYYTGAEMRAYVSGPVQPDGFAADLRFQTGYPQLMPRMSVTANGKVGIGTTTPSFDLHTVGHTHTTGDFFGRLHVDDNGSMDSAPDTYVDELYLERHASTAFSVLPVTTAADGGLLTLAPGGNSLDHQLFFAEEGIFHRSWQGDAPDWGTASWFKMLTSEDISGTPNRLAKFTGESSLGDSQLWDDGTQVGLGTDAPAAGFFLEIAGRTLVNEALDVAKNAVIQQGLQVGTDAFVGEDLSVASNGVIGDQLKVGGITQIGGALTVTDDATVTGHLGSNTATVDQTLTVGTTATPGSHRLYVGGSILAEEVTVKLEANWPDYVFSDSYNLPELKEVADFIDRHRHLPGFQSAQTIEATGGFEIGSTQRLLVEKVEELTLYAIAADQENKALKAQLEALEARLAQLEQQ
ncbi:hypothetical protein [Phaeodactylibacter xiamenensis]|uniref:hypothetical protein n=1 Tax=Phaeodactylibacter xiamenensis TaxID=1524460 RepID=UPI0024A8324C|nr:hypothetical protein [Phaeodactylibacter xiamenensis]